VISKRERYDVVAGRTLAREVNHPPFFFDEGHPATIPTLDADVTPLNHGRQ
jgi:hypothetical protein